MAAKKLVFLQTDKDFSQFRQSKITSSPSLKLRYRYNTNQNFPRFGFIIPKKILPNVTDRNRIRRRIRSLLDKHINHIRPADFLFFPLKNSLKLKFEDFEKEFTSLFEKARLWKR